MEAGYPRYKDDSFNLCHNREHKLLTYTRDIRFLGVLALGIMAQLNHNPPLRALPVKNYLLAWNETNK